MNNKRRKLKPGVEMPIRIMRVFAIIMQVGVCIWAFATLVFAAICDNIQWYDVGLQFINLLIFLFWHWVHELTSDLLEYA
jgi:hypothetical protein